MDQFEVELRRLIGVWRLNPPRRSELSRHTPIRRLDSTSNWFTFGVRLTPLFHSDVTDRLRRWNSEKIHIGQEIIKSVRAPFSSSHPISRFLKSVLFSAGALSPINENQLENDEEFSYDRVLRLFRERPVIAEVQMAKRTFTDRRHEADFYKKRSGWSETSSIVGTGRESIRRFSLVKREFFLSFVSF